MILKTEQNIIKVFKFSWVFLLISVMCDLTITKDISIFGASTGIQLSSIGILLYILAFITAVPFKKVINANIRQFDRRIMMLLSGLLIVAFISSIFGKYLASSLMTTLFRYFLLFVCLICTLIYCSRFRELRFFIIYSFIYINVLLLVSCLLDFYVPEFNAFLIKHFGHMMAGESSLKYEGIVYIRPSGFLTESNLTALSLVLSNLLLLFNIEKFKRKWPIYLNYLVTGYVFGMLGSRSALIMYVAMLIAAYIFKVTARKEIIYFFLIFTLIQISTPQTRSRYFGSAERKRLEKYDTEVGRVLLWRSSFEAFKTNPLIGVGTDGFYKESLVFLNMFRNDEDFNIDYDRLMETGKGGVNSHSLYMTILTEYGIIGFTILLLLIIATIVHSARKRLTLFLIFFIGLLLVSSVSSYAPYYKFYLLICMILYVNMVNNLRLTEEKTNND